MTIRHRVTLFTAGSLLALTWSASAATPERVRTANGIVIGAPEENGVRAFRGIPFAAPPTGDLRFKPPQPAKNWTAPRPAQKFGPRCMQRPVFGDMGFRSDGMSEDCLYLNVWTPAKSPTEKLPVLVYFYGGGFIAGDGSEPRYDGEVMARKGIVALTVNYRLGVFGFLAHPELTKESPRHASGNQGLLDQAAALAWVQKNIAAFGGDPKRVTIAGESAGSISVSAQMASPLSRNLFAGAIGESGASINPTLPPVSLEKAEAAGKEFAAFVSAADVKALRAMTADALLEATGKPGAPRLGSNVDGYFLPKTPAEIFAAGEQAQVPLLAGWNSEENNYRSILRQDEPSPENYAKAVARDFGDRAPDVLKAYPGFTKDEVIESGTALAGDRFIAFSTWKWLDLQSKTGVKPVYRYYYSRPRPAMNPEMGNATANLAGGVTRGAAAPGAAAAPPRPLPKGAVHSAEIEYAMGNLDTNKVYAWTPDDHMVSETFQGFFANFVKTGDPNGSGLPQWPAANRGSDTQVMRIDVQAKAAPDVLQHRYRLLDEIYSKP
jgi:para-nitrobenzyl esterase